MSETPKTGFLAPWPIYVYLTLSLTPRSYVIWNPQGGGGGYSNFFRMHRPGPSIYRSPQKNIRNFKHPKKIIEILATQKISQFCTLTLKKDPKLQRNDPQTSPILWWPQKNIQKIFIPQKNIHSSENPQKYWNSEFWTPKNGPSLRMCENIRVPPPPPWAEAFVVICTPLAIAVPNLNAVRVHINLKEDALLQAVRQILTLKAPPIICSRQRLQFFPLFQK